MATKMNTEIAKRVKALGINAKNEEEAREALLGILNDNGIEGMEEEDTDTLIEIAESFVEEGDTNSEPAGEVEAEDNDTDEDALANEVEEEDNDTEAEETTEDEGDEFDGMDRSALKAYIKEQGLDIKVKKSWSDDDVRNEIRKAVAETETETAEEEPEKEEPAVEEKKPVKKAVNAKKDAAKVAPAKKADKVEKTEKKISKRGVKIDPKNNEEDRKVFDCLHELFPEDEYIYAWVSSAGVTIKHRGKNSQRAMVLIENCSRQVDESIKCNLYLLTFNKQTAILDEAGIEYEVCWSGAPFIKGTTLEAAVETIKTLMPHITATVQKIDKRLGENRAKMEESLAKKSAPAASAKKAAPVTAKKTVKK